MRKVLLYLLNIVAIYWQVYKFLSLSAYSWLYLQPEVLMNDGVLNAEEFVNCISQAQKRAKKGENMLSNIAFVG